MRKYVEEAKAAKTKEELLEVLFDVLREHTKNQLMGDALAKFSRRESGGYGDDFVNGMDPILLQVKEICLKRIDLKASWEF